VITLAAQPLARWREQNQSRIENWQRGFYRFRQSKLSLVGLALIVFIFLVAIFGPFIAPHPQDAEGAVRAKIASAADRRSLVRVPTN
jgi:ABC-type antimicrobial peptide transport system permease subunit